MILIAAKASGSVSGSRAWPAKLQGTHMEYYCRLKRQHQAKSGQLELQQFVHS